MQKQSERLFLELLQCAIWNRQPNASLFEDLRPEIWNSIFETASKQAVRALIADVILALPANCLPLEKRTIMLFKQINSMEKINRLVNQTLVEICNKYRELNIPVVLLKGQGVAQNYPKPLLRNAGDIDLFLYQKGDYDKANEWVKEQGYTYHVDERDGHRAFEMGRIMVENHKFITFFEKKKYNLQLVELLNKIITAKRFDEIEIEGFKMKKLPADLNAFYIFLHLFFHFIHGGVGLRQFCDWVLFLKTHHQNIDKERFTSLAKSFDVYYSIQLFAQAAIEYLGASPDIFPFQLTKKSRYSRMIMEEIFVGGNFGFHHTPYLKPYNTWTRRWLIFKNTVSKTVRFGTIAPQYMLIIPIVSLISRGKKTLGL